MQRDLDPAVKTLKIANRTRIITMITRLTGILIAQGVLIVPLVQQLK